MDGQLVKDLIPCFIAFNSPPVLIQFNSLVTRLLCRLLLPELATKSHPLERKGTASELNLPFQTIYVPRYGVRERQEFSGFITIHTKPCRLVNAACSYPARDFITKDERPLYSRQSTQIRIKNLYTTLDYCCYGATVRPIPSHPGFVGPPPVDCYCCC